MSLKLCVRHSFIKNVCGLSFPAKLCVAHGFIDSAHSHSSPEKLCVVHSFIDVNNWTTYVFEAMLEA